MKLFKKILFSFLWLFGIFWSITSFAIDWSNSEDFLEQAFHEAIENDTVVWKGFVWTSKQSVWNYLMWRTTEINLTEWTMKHWNSFAISVTMFLVRATLVLAITMIIYNWVMFVVKSSKWEAPKDVLKNIIYIIVWVLLALGSLIIINLARSVGSTVINIF